MRSVSSLAPFSTSTALDNLLNFLSDRLELFEGGLLPLLFLLRQILLRLVDEGFHGLPAQLFHGRHESPVEIRVHLREHRPELAVEGPGQQ